MVPTKVQVRQPGRRRVVEVKMARIFSRSEGAFAADRAADKLMNQRTRVIQFLNVFLVLFGLLVFYLEWPLWLVVLIGLGWVGNIIHNNDTLLLHELVEINDQLTGRKDELRAFITQSPSR